MKGKIAATLAIFAIAVSFAGAAQGQWVKGFKAPNHPAGSLKVQ